MAYLEGVECGVGCGVGCTGDAIGTEPGQAAEERLMSAAVVGEWAEEENSLKEH